VCNRDPQFQTEALRVSEKRSPIKANLARKTDIPITIMACCQHTSDGSPLNSAMVRAVKGPCSCLRFSPEKDFRSRHSLPHHGFCVTARFSMQFSSDLPRFVHEFVWVSSPCFSSISSPWSFLTIYWEIAVPRPLFGALSSVWMNCQCFVTTSDIRVVLKFRKAVLP
jgi:hypothetical protein